MATAVTLTGFQLLQLLGVVDHRSDVRVVVSQSSTGNVHARLVDRADLRFLPETPAQAEGLAKAAAEQAEAARIRREACGHQLSDVKKV